ncbi:ARHGAP27 [Bugula neritina]|uniref:ARHGAP27 n=1 Tax=Bugula neritina TaxID=10212 RepID=A0A7J7K311_BUGNE|nr:ARHGAP27 [Bugula neritina]
MDLSCVLSCVIFTVQGGYTLRNAAQSASAFDTQKRGYLFRAKLIEGKKKVKYKQDAELGKPEIIVDLRQSSIDWASKERSNRKNVLEITSDNGNIYLLQHEDHILVRQWFTVLNGKIKKFNSSVTDEPEEATVPEIERNNNQKGQSSTLPASSKFKHAKRLSKCKNIFYAKPGNSLTVFL